jgi:lipopolysaccharide biosynthesis glycosyltransferase
MGCDTENYVNSGVLLMNLPRIKEKFDARQVLMWFRRNRHYVKFPDQDLINSYFSGDIKTLESRFNNRKARFYSDVNDEGVADSILHFTVNKPWEEPKGTALDSLYWKAFLKTPWGRLPPEELVYTMLEMFQKSPYMHRRTAQCCRKIFYRLRTEVFLNTASEIVSFLAYIPYNVTKYFLTRRKLFR